ncbi:MAG TPA: class II glutamine amidotransferase [Sandaracinaceae bacterium LLY-WYZ-13_1]|nr:class II glutamine amidotransferase [Sandaracinaceae bacterium LLY-WYZ-13_1]
MGRLLGYMANRTDRLGDVLDAEHDAIAPPPDFRPDAWGIGFYQGGEVLHKKRPKLEEAPIDWETVARGVRSDCVVLHFRHATVGDFRADNTHPFRMRQWTFAHNGTVEGFNAIRARLLESMPDFLRRNIRGSTDSEHVFGVLLSFLHDAGQLDAMDTDDKTVLGALRSTVALVDRHCAEVGAPPSTLNLILTNGRSMYALRRDAPLFYAERSGLPGDGPTTKGAGAFRYVLVFSDGEATPPGYEAVEEGSILVVDRNLSVSTHSL